MLVPSVQREQLETFAGLEEAGVCHGFVGRVPGIDVDADRAEALARLDVFHLAARQALGVADRVFVTAEQVHGSRVEPLPPFPGFPSSCADADGMITNRPDVCLGIYVADCCAVYLVDPVRRAVGLVHSGRKGTELGIVRNAIDALARRFGTRAGDLIVQLSPCIRPPWYEVDFAAEIVAQCRAAGVTRVFDPGTCTAAQPARYYSYRREKGRTGRMLALLALR